MTEKPIRIAIYWIQWKLVGWVWNGEHSLPCDPKGSFFMVLPYVKKCESEEKCSDEIQWETLVLVSFALFIPGNGHILISLWHGLFDKFSTRQHCITSTFVIMFQALLLKEVCVDSYTIFLRYIHPHPKLLTITDFFNLGSWNGWKVLERWRLREII